MEPTTQHFYYSNTETKISKNGDKTIRKVYIKDGKGYKTITKYHKGKKIGSVKKPIHDSHMQSIGEGTFIPKLFMDCRTTMQNKTRKRRG